MTGGATIIERLERLPITSYQRKIFAVIATAWFFDSVDVAMLTFILPEIKAEFSLASGDAGLLASMSFLGMFIGAGSAGMLADRFGRIVIFRWSIVMWGLASLLCAFAPNIHALMFFRFLLGIGMAMELPVGQSLVCEFVPARVRGKYIALLEGMWPIGFIAAGLLAQRVVPHFGWRGAFIAEAIPAIFVLVIRRIVPESPRWLSESGNHEEASRIVSIIESKVLGSEAKGLNDSIQVSAVQPNKKTSPLIVFQPQYRKRTIMLWSLWFFALLGYYGLTTWLAALLEARGMSFSKSTDFIILISLTGIPGFACAAWLVEAWGRKPMMITTLVGSAICAYFYGTVDNTNVMIAFGCAMQFFAFGMWCVLYAYTPELYPTYIRATGAGFASSIGRVGAVLGPWLIGAILAKSHQQAVFGFAAASLFTAALSVLIMGKETKGKRLEEI